MLNAFKSSNTFDPDNNIPDLSGRVYIVTGGSTGIGFGIMAHLLQHHAQKIYLLSNKEEHASEAIEELRKWGNVDKVVEWRQCNLQDFEQTRAVAEELKGELQRLDALVCNAGLGVGVYNQTKDNLDSHMQVNHFSQMLLTMILLPVILKTPNGRIVHQSSEIHRFTPSSTRFESREEMNQDIGATNLYARTKLAQILFVRGLQRRLDSGAIRAPEGNRIFINATHPGGVETPQQEQAVEAYGTLGKIGVMAIRPFLKDAVKEGCRPALFATTADAIVEERITAKYIIPDRKISDPNSQALDDEMGERLWALSEMIFKEKFGSLPY